MDPGYKSPLIDFFRRGEVARDVRLLAAEGALAPRAHEQLALLILLSDDPDGQIAVTARATLDALPPAALDAFLARPDVPAPMRDFFAGRGVAPAPSSAPPPGSDAPLVDTGGDPPAGALAPGATDDDGPDPQVLSTLSIMDRMKLAMKGTRAQRAVLIRDSNKLVASAVLSSPKLTETEVEGFAKQANLSEDVLRIIGTNRAWTKNYTVVASLVKNPKTPTAIAMTFVQRLNDRDLKSLATDRNAPEAIRLAARKFVVKGKKEGA